MHKKRPNIVFSTTYGWNPGDQFIHFGIMRLLQQLIGEFNPFIYNRNPDNHQIRMLAIRPIELQVGNQKVKGNLELPSNTHDNGWHQSIPIDAFDLVVFAGSPEWMGIMNQPLTEALAGSNVPVLYLGIGGFERIAHFTLDMLGAVDQQALKSAKLITCRDTLAQKIIAPIESLQITCPALLCADTALEQPHKELKRLALSTQINTQVNGQGIPEEVYNYTVDLFKQLSERYECGLVCHNSFEVAMFEDVFGKLMPIYYSYDARDYFELYQQFDYTINTRVHGAGICASMGIPGMLISGSARKATAVGFGTEVVDYHTTSVDELLVQIENLDIAKQSEHVLKLKHELQDRYHEVLKPVLSEIFPEIL